MNVPKGDQKIYRLHIQPLKMITLKDLSTQGTTYLVYEKKQTQFYKKSHQLISLINIIIIYNKK